MLATAEKCGSLAIVVACSRTHSAERMLLVHQLAKFVDCQIAAVVLKLTNLHQAQGLAIESCAYYLEVLEVLSQRVSTLLTCIWHRKQNVRSGTAAPLCVAFCSKRNKMRPHRQKKNIQ